MALLSALASEEIAEDGNVTKPRNFVHDVGDAVIHEAGDDEALAILQLEFGVGLAGAEGRDGGAGDRNCIGEVERAHLRHNVEVNVAIGLNDRSKFQAYAELTKLDGDGGEAGRIGLDDRDGKLATGEEAGFLAIDRNQIRLS